MKRFFSIPFAIVCGLIFIFPLLWMLFVSFLPDIEVMDQMNLRRIFSATFTLSNYPDAFERMPVFRIILNSLLFVLPIATIGTLINASAGFAFARLRFKGSNLAFFILTALIIIPFESLALPLFLLLGVNFGLMNTISGLFLPYLAKAFNIYFLRQFYLSLPAELEEAARVEGASWFRIFFRIALPLSKPALVTCIIIDFTIHWSEYLWPLIMTDRVEMETIQPGLGHFYTLPPIQWGDIMAYSVVSTIPVILIFIFFQRYLVPTKFFSGIKG